MGFQNCRPEMVCYFCFVFELLFANPGRLLLENSSIFSQFQFLGHELDRITGRFMHVWMSFPVIRSGPDFEKKTE